MGRQEKHRRKRRRNTRRIVAVWTALILAELVAAAAPAGIAAAVLVPIGYAARGCRAMGVEWFLIGAVYVAAYTAIHNTVCNKLEQG